LENLSPQIFANFEVNSGIASVENNDLGKNFQKDGRCTRF